MFPTIWPKRFAAFMYGFIKSRRYHDIRIGPVVTSIERPLRPVREGKVRPYDDRDNERRLLAPSDGSPLLEGCEPVVLLVSFLKSFIISPMPASSPAVSLIAVIPLFK